MQHSRDKNYVRLLVGRSIFGQHKDRQQHLFTSNVRKKQSFNINNSKKKPRINENKRLKTYINKF